jgi:hypothetical protein
MNRTAAADPPGAEFDPVRCVHRANGRPVVHFSHHLAIIAVRAVDESLPASGGEIARRAAERAFLPILGEALARSDADPEARPLEICEAVWARCGMGNLRIVRHGPGGGTAEMSRSQADEGWLRAHGPRARPVNHLTRGFLAAAWAALAGAGEGTYEVRETESLVAGAERSVFVVERKAGMAA